MSKHPPYVEMVDCAIHSGLGAMVSRQKIDQYLETHWGIDPSRSQVKNAIKEALTRRMDEDRVYQEKRSFAFTRTGTKAFKEEYEVSDDHGEAEKPKKTTKKVQEASKAARKVTPKGKK
ncbi:hypothetical protein JCM8202_002940 [Rhodotorula sphaerocarpa]